MDVEEFSKKEECYILSGVDGELFFFLVILFLTIFYRRQAYLLLRASLFKEHDRCLSPREDP